MTKQYGFVAPQKDSQDYVFGAFNSLPKVVLQPNSNWADFLPMYENQSTSIFETYGCVVFGTLNVLETLVKRHTGKEANYAERYNYNLIGIEPPGTDPKLGAESIRKEGVIDQKLLPFTSDLKSFASPRPMAEEFIEVGHEWLKKYGLGYEWVFQGQTDKEALRECLKYSPIGVSVTAWHKNSKGQYYSPPGPNNHWCVLYNINSDGEYLIFDTYDGGFKKLTPDYNIQYAMRYHLVVYEQVQTKINWFGQLLKQIEALFAYLVSKGEIKDTVPEAVPEPKPLQKDLVDVALSFIGKDASPKNLAPQELSCAEGVSNIISQVWPDFPKDVLSTVDLHSKLKASPHFKGTLTPKKGCVVVSPRTSTTPGHTGIFISDTEIASNDSRAGKFEINYTWNSWIRDIGRARGLHTYLHEPVYN